MNAMLGMLFKDGSDRPGKKAKVDDFNVERQKWQPKHLPLCLRSPFYGRCLDACRSLSIEERMILDYVFNKD